VSRPARKIGAVRRALSFISRKWVSIAVVIAAALLMQVVEYHGLLAGLEGWFFDRQNRWVSKKATSYQNIIVINIDDESYDACFSSKSPLAPGKVLKLLDVVSGHNAKVIGVDLITDTHGFPRPTPKLPVIWALQTIEWRGGLLPGYALGKQVTEKAIPRDDGLNFIAPPIYPREEDLRIRRYRRSVELFNASDLKYFPAPTWARVIAEQYCNCDLGEKPEDVFLTFRQHADWIPARKLLDPNDCTGAVTGAFGPTDTGLGQIADPTEMDRKIVLIGGTFRKTDLHYTPLGEISAIAVNAAAVAAELDHDYVRELHWSLILGLDILAGILIICIEDQFKPKAFRQKFWICVGAGLTLFVLSFSLLRVGILWVSWIGLVASLLLVFLVENYWENPKYEHEH
jgi:hypothetical protein